MQYHGLGRSFARLSSVLISILVTRLKKLLSESRIWCESLESGSLMIQLLYQLFFCGKVTSQTHICSPTGEGGGWEAPWEVWTSSSIHKLWFGYNSDRRNFVPLTRTAFWIEDLSYCRNFASNSRQHVRPSYTLLSTHIRYVRVLISIHFLKAGTLLPTQSTACLHELYTLPFKSRPSHLFSPCRSCYPHILYAWRQSIHILQAGTLLSTHNTGCHA
jgi:hypothetical protein